jgi:hypothetical protein
MNRHRLFRTWLPVCVAVLACPGLALADPIYGNSGLEGLGAFDGTFTYTPKDAGDATLSVKLNNLNTAAEGGFITAFIFRNPQGRITGATMTSSNLNFALLGQPNFLGDINGMPFGSFDLGASTGGAFEGGGKPQKGIPAGGSATFTFKLTGNGLNLLNTQSFFLVPDPPDASKGHHAHFVARFRGYHDEGSDKVPGNLGGGTGHIAGESPEPATLTLAGISATALLGFAWIRKRAVRPA